MQSLTVSLAIVLNESRLPRADSMETRSSRVNCLYFAIWNSLPPVSHFSEGLTSSLDSEELTSTFSPLGWKYEFQFTHMNFQTIGAIRQIVTLILRW